MFTWHHSIGIKIPPLFLFLSYKYEALHTNGSDTGVWGGTGASNSASPKQENKLYYVNASMGLKAMLLAISYVNNFF